MQSVLSLLLLKGGYLVCNVLVHFMPENRLEDTVGWDPVSQ